MLARAGWDVATVVGQRLTSSTDRALAAVCRDEHRCLVTLDLDFANTLQFPPRASSGIAVLRLPSPIASAHIDLALELLVRTLGSGTLDGKLWIIEVDRIREHEGDAD